MARIIFGKKNRAFRLAILFCLTILLVVGCGGKNPYVPPYVPSYVPPQYLGAIEIYEHSIDDFAIYHYISVEGSPIIHDHKYVFFPNIEITEHKLAAKQKGYLVLHKIRCKLADPAVLDLLRTGMRVDIVGLCQGVVEENGIEVIKIIDVLILPAGAVDITAGGDAVSFGY